MIVEFKPEYKRHHHAGEDRNAAKCWGRYRMFFSCIGPVKKFKPVYHKNYRGNKDQCKHKRHYISEKAKFEIGKTKGDLQQVKVVVH